MSAAGVPSRRAGRHVRAGVFGAAVASAVGVTVLAAGCGSAARPGAAAAATPARPATSLPLATSLSGSRAAWAVVPMGAAAGPNLFWELFRQPAGSTQWKLATPPDIATNGAISLSSPDGQAVVTGIHPSLRLNFSPVSSTPDGGRTWTAGAPDPGLASVPDALAAAPSHSPGGGQLIALDRTGTVELARSGHAAWTALVRTRTLAATGPGRACRLTALTAVAFAGSGTPAVAGSCGQPGVAGIFTRTGGSWRAAGPSLTGSLSQQKIQVLRLVQADGRLTALLQAGTGPAASLRAAWLTGSGWTTSPALAVTGAAVQSSSFGRDGAVGVALSSGRAALLAAPGQPWQTLPKLPAGRSVTLALPGAGVVDALVPSGSLLAVWQLKTGGSGAGAWVKTQQVKVPIGYGSSS